MANGRSSPEAEPGCHVDHEEVLDVLRPGTAWLRLTFSLILILISAVGSSLVQTNGGTVAITDMRWVTPSGKTLSALLFTPDEATAMTPAPAIVTSHGWFNSREMQDSNYVELARRGYVVVAIDMYGHGGSDAVTNGEEEVGATGMYDAVRLVADLPFVDIDRIGVTGHSNGARAANFAVELDDAAQHQLISAVLLVSNEPVYRNQDGLYENIYGSRDVGVVADQYDEFFFRSSTPDGSVRTLPRDYIGTPDAQSFLHYGGEVTSGDIRRPDKVYSDGADGALRVIHTPAQEHTWAPMSSKVATYTVDFFEAALGAPEPISSASQVWQVKAGFNALGLAAFPLFLVAVTQVLLLTRPFAALRLPRSRASHPVDAASGSWFWAPLGLTTVVSAASYFIYNLLAAGATETGSASATVSPLLLQQPASFVIGTWAAFNGLVAMGVAAFSYRWHGRRHGQDLRTLGVLPGMGPMLRGMLLGGVVTIAALALLAVVAFFFTTDFRLYVFALKALPASKVQYFLLYLPFFLVYFVASSISTAALGRTKLLGRDWVTTVVLALSAALGPVILLLWQYLTFWTTGDLVQGFNGTFSIWLIPVGATLAVAVVIARQLHRATGNPCAGAVVNASIVTLMTVTTTLTIT